jgi:DNA-binding FadR family transcriptional regulator
MIERAGLKVGDRLPPEISLASTLGVGRSTIR